MAVVVEGIALGGKLVDQVPDTKLVFAVGALKRRDFVVHHGLELGSPADGAGDGVVHRRHLTADGLAHGGHGLLGQLVRLGQAHGDLGHGGGHETELLRPPDEKGEEPEDDDGHQDGGGRRQGRGAQIAAARSLVGDDAIGKEAADDEPDDGSAERDEERRARGPLLKGEDQAADGRDVVVGGCGQPALRGRARGAARPGQMPGRGCGA